MLERLRTVAGLWTKKGLAWLRQEEMPTAARLKRDLLPDELTEAKRRVRTVTKALDPLGERHPAVLVRRTIPGVGIRTAETVAAYLDNAIVLRRRSRDETVRRDRERPQLLHLRMPTV